MAHYTLILAGGEGTRLAPLSTPERPKQFLALWGQASLLQQTYRRVSPLALPAQTYIATSARSVALVREQVPEVPLHQVIGEPIKRNTAPIIALMAWWCMQQDAQAVMGVFPADHYIGNTPDFHAAWRRACAAARAARQLITLGVRPTAPSTAYGYIQRGRPVPAVDPALYAVETFVEKPPPARAQAYCDAGYLWNSGMFAWQATVLMEEVAAHQPALYQLLTSLPQTEELWRAEVLQSFFSRAPSLSIDEGILERSSRVQVLAVHFPWSDVGSPEALQRLRTQGVT